MGVCSNTHRRYTMSAFFANVRWFFWGLLGLLAFAGIALVWPFRKVAVSKKTLAFAIFTLALIALTIGLISRPQPEVDAMGVLPHHLAVQVDSAPVVRAYAAVQVSRYEIGGIQARNNACHTYSVGA